MGTFVYPLYAMYCICCPLLLLSHPVLTRMDVLLLPLNPLGRNSDPDSTLTPASIRDQAMGQTLSRESLVYFINLKLTFMYYVTKSPSFCELK